jgi:CheY-like chemotaxis protein
VAGEHDAQRVPAQRRTDSTRRPGVARRVLVVDDNVDAAAMLDMLLRSLGHETRIAHEGATALRIAEEFHPDIVLLDIGMPGIDGYEVARRLRTLKSRPMRIVAVTGWGQEADRERSREAGFDLHLVKPVDAHELARALNDRNGATLH